MTQAQSNTLKQQKSKSDISGIENLIRAMLKKHGSPLMLIRRSVLEKQYKRFRKCLPEVTPYYAIKANPNPLIIKTFVELGASFDVASANERLWTDPSPRSTRLHVESREGENVDRRQ